MHQAAAAATPAAPTALRDMRVWAPLGAGAAGVATGAVATSPTPSPVGGASVGAAIGVPSPAGASGVLSPTGAIPLGAGSPAPIIPESAAGGVTTATATLVGPDVGFGDTVGEMVTVGVPVVGDVVGAEGIALGMLVGPSSRHCVFPTSSVLALQQAAPAQCSITSSSSAYLGSSL